MQRQVEPAEVLELARRLISIPSDREEREIALFLQQYLQKQGIETVLQEAAPGRLNVVATLEGSAPGPTVILNGHLDTVPPGDGWSVPPYAGEVRDDDLYGRGAADMKGAIAAMALAGVMLKRERQPQAGTLMLAFVADEEIGNQGMNHFLSRLPQADYAVVGEATNLDIAIAHRGVSRYRLKTYGRSVHASKPKEGINAIVKMARAINVLEEYGRSLEAKTHPLLGSPTLSIGTIRGGTEVNVVPNECTIEIDRRLLPGEVPEEAFEDIRKYLAGIQAEDPEFKFSFEQTNCTLPAELAPTHPLVLKAVAAAEMILGRTVRVRPFSATCEAALLLAKGIPTIICGPGDIGQAHAVDEHVGVKELALATQVYAHMVTELLNG